MKVDKKVVDEDMERKNKLFLRIVAGATVLAIVYLLIRWVL